MATKERLTLTYEEEEELGERLEQMREKEGIKHESDAGRRLMRRGLDEWEAEQASYPGSEVVERGIEVAAVGFVVGLVATVVTRGAVSIGAAFSLALVVFGALTAHYAMIKLQQRGGV